MERQQHIFVLFGELRIKQCLQDVKDLGIGVGLNCSRDLSRAIGGNVKLISSKKGHTHFQITIPLDN